MESDYKTFFKDKKVTVMGLGLLGRGVGDVRFIAESGAREVLVTDLKTEEQLKESINKLRGLGNLKFVLGEHRLKDFKDRDLIIKSAGVPLNSEYIKTALDNKIPVHMSTALFAKFYPGTIIGVTGTRGKTTVTHLIFHTLKKAGNKAFLGGNVRGISTIAHLPRAEADEVAVLELDSWQLQGFTTEKISPHISVFTNLMPDHLNYYSGDLDRYLSDKANIFRFQKKSDMLVLGEKMVRILENSIGLDKIPSKKIITSASDVPRDWKVKLPGEHNLYNVSCAIEALRQFGLSEEEIKEGVETFRGVDGRLEFRREVNGRKIYNDTTATTPEATLAGLRAVSNNKNVVLIMGGTDKEIDPKNLVENIDRYTKTVVLLPGSGTDKMVPKLVGKAEISIQKTDSLEESVKEALNSSKSGDVILFSPGFASFGMFKNEYDRGEQFNKIVESL